MFVGWFLPNDATWSVVSAQQLVHPSVCDVEVLEVCCGHIGWNTSKIILYLISLGCSLAADSNKRDLL